MYRFLPGASRTIKNMNSMVLYVKTCMNLRATGKALFNLLGFCSAFLVVMRLIQFASETRLSRGRLICPQVQVSFLQKPALAVHTKANATLLPTSWPDQNWIPKRGFVFSFACHKLAQRAPPRRTICADSAERQ